MIAQLVRTDSELEAACRVLRLLRPAYSEAAIVETVRAQQAADGYRLAFVDSDGVVVCVAGFVIAHKLAWGRHLYVDDLVTVEDRRSQGAGSTMIVWLKQHARDNGCRELHLDSGVTRYAAHRFYLRHGFVIQSHHFAITDLDGT